MWLIAGLGNPESKYDNTRHNAGFDVMDVLSKDTGIAIQEKKFKGLIGRGMIGSERVLLLKPLTYMNLSGESVREAAMYYDIPVENILIICDDIYLETGNLRIRKSGSHGGQNGLKNIINQLGSGDFKRIRMGVGPQPEHMDLVKFVLSHFGQEERKAFDSAASNAVKAVRIILDGQIDQAMNLYNGKRT